MNKEKILKYIVIFSLIVFIGFSLDDYEEKLLKEKLESFDKSLRDKNISEIIEIVGKSFIGTEYVAGTLDENVNTEKLIIKISGLDCVTFVENTLAISRIIQKGKPCIEEFKKELQLIRYRDGEIEDYTSRLHYFTDWIYDNQQKGVVQDITKSIGGVPYRKDINFMSTHTKSYKQLQNNQEAINKIKEIESEINNRKLYYIPKNEVDSYYDNFKTGDIIATTTVIDGLDVTHTGFILKTKNITAFLHASINAKEVIITKEDLKSYLKSDKKKTGIIIVRPLDVN